MVFAVGGPATCAKCDVSAFLHRGMCRAVSEEALAELNSIGMLRKYAKGQIIIDQGEDAAIVGNVVTGILKLTRIMPEGHIQIVGLLYPSDFFGRLFSNHQACSIEAATRTTLCCFPRRAFERVIDRFPEVGQAIMANVFDELDATREWLAMMSCRDTASRIAAFLLMLQKRASNQRCGHEPPVISVPISRTDLAGFLGTTVETISRQIHAMVRRGVIRIIDARTFVVLDGQGLSELAGDFDLTTLERPAASA